MNRFSHLFSARLGTALLALFCLAGADFFADNSPLDFWDLGGTTEYNHLPPAPLPANGAPRIRLFRFAPGFLSDPVNVCDEASDLPGVTVMPGTNPPPDQSQTDNGPAWIQFGAGYDNPFVDLRRPGDPGGFGYYRVNTQVQLFDSPTTACTVDVQAVAPAGIQFAGMPNGPTVFCPAFSVFQTLGEHTALQGFVSKNVPISGSDSSSFLQRNVQYGMAVQRPLAADGPEGWRNVFFSVGALGNFRSQFDNFNNWNVLPGLQWHVNDNWWVSSGVLVPVGPANVAARQWQLTCFFQF